MNDKRKNTPPSKDDVRICIDPNDLNKALKRPHHPMVITVEEVAKPTCRCSESFTSLDACSGYWQLPEDHESSKLLTFNTSWGRHRFKDSLLVCPQPLNSTKGRWTDSLKGSPQVQQYYYIYFATLKLQSNREQKLIIKLIITTV